MEAEIVRIWASPSTLHLRLVYWGKQKKWMKSADVHIPLAEIPSQVREQIRVSDGFDVEPQPDVPLF